MGRFPYPATFAIPLQQYYALPCFQHPKFRFFVNSVQVFREVYGQ